MNATLTSIILDSSALVALANPLDADHERALVISSGLAQDHHRNLFLPDAVFVETLNVLGRKTSHAKALQTAEVLLAGDPYVLVESSAEITHAALAHWNTQTASTSFTDCLVMAIADFYDTFEIFGFDAVFGKSGYRLPA